MGRMFGLPPAACAAAVMVAACVTGAAHASVTFGNTTPFEIQSDHSPNFVLGVQVVIPIDIEATSFGMMYGHEDFGPPHIANAIFGLYSSGGDDLPSLLMAVTDPINLSAQQTYDNIPFTSSAIVPAGTYWMMALYESQANPRMSVQDSGSLVAFWSNAYGDGMPANAPGSTTYTGQNFNYWINGLALPAPGALALLGVAGLLSARRRRR